MPNPQELLAIAQESLQAGEQGDPISGGPPGSGDRRTVERLLGIMQSQEQYRTPVRDIGVIGAAGAGLKRGVLEPFQIITGRPEEDLRIDEPGEKVANFLGSMAGLGISFVPFAAGTGVALRGVGLAAKMSPAVYAFTRNTIAGGLQFAGTSETLEEVPKNTAMGVAFGGAIEGFFLARAMRGRAGHIINESLSSTGSPIADVVIDPIVIAKEIELAPALAKSPNRMAAELQGLSTEGMTYDQILTNLAADEATTIRLDGLAESHTIMNYARSRVPSAQVTSRSYQGGTLHEVLIHNPASPEELLTSKQLTQWRTTGSAEGMEVLYAGKSYEITGGIASEGRIQIRDPARPSVVFAPLVSEIEKPIVTRFYSAASRRREVLTAAVRDAETNVGFVVPNANNAEGALRARRGIVNTEGFSVTEDLNAFKAGFRDKLVKIQAASPDEAFVILMKQEGIKGLIEKEAGITTKIHMFDQGTVSYVREVPRTLTRKVVKEVPVPRGRRAPAQDIVERMKARNEIAAIDKQIDFLSRPSSTNPTNVANIEALKIARGTIVRDTVEANFPSTMKITEDIPIVGMTLDNAVTSVDLASGQLMIHSLTPSWRNSLTSSLRAKGIPEKEIVSYLDDHVAQLGRTLDNLMDPEFQSLKKASEFQYGGCI